MNRIILILICLMSLVTRTFSQPDLKWWNYTGSTQAHTAFYSHDNNQTFVFDGIKTWIASTAGLTLYENNSFVKNYNGSNSGLTSNQINCIKKDSEGNLWMGTYSGGIVKFNHELDEWSHFFEMPFGKKVIQVRDIVIDNNDILYAICRLDDDTKNKLIKFDGQTWEEIIAPNGWKEILFS